MPRKGRIFYGWYIVAASVGVNFYLSIVIFQGLQAFFLPIAHEFNWSRALTSGAFSLRQLEAGVLAPVVGFLVDRWGSRAVILMGVVFAGLGMILLGYVNSLGMFYAAFLVVTLGVDGASHGISWAVAITNWFRRLRGRALGIGMLGPVIGGPFVVIVALLEQTLGWRVAVILCGIGLWVVGIPLAMVARTRPEPYGYLPDGDARQEEDKSRASVPQEMSFDGLTVSQALRTRDFWVLTLLFGAPSLGVSGLMVHLIPLLRGMEYSATGAATVLGIVFLLSGIGRIGAGAMADRLDFRLVLVGLFLSQAVAVLLLSFLGPSQYWQIGVFALLFGVGFGGPIPLRPFLIMRLFGARSNGALQGLVQGGATVAGVVGPVFYGWVFDVTESYDPALFATVVILVLATLPVFLLASPQRVALKSG